MRYIALATEDEISEEIGVRLAAEAGLGVEQKLRRGGNGYLRSRFKSFCQMSSITPVLVITDLDREICPAKLIEKWFRQRQRVRDVLVRVAVREIESWLLADHTAMSRLFGLRVGALPREPDALADPKSALISLARRAPRAVRDDILPDEGALASQGLGYNRRLAAVIKSSWDPERAAFRSPSLQRARGRLRELAGGRL